MTRAFALLLAALTMLAGAGQARAQFFFEDSRDIMAGLFRPGMPSGTSPIPRTTVSFPYDYKPGTILVATGER
ncbi:MAG: L,D-transpeptidase, partial [Bradyrhizobium sp.]